MAIKVPTSKVLHDKGEAMLSIELFNARADFIYSFGWVNASYVYGLQIVNAHMKRALGAVTPWETFKAMNDAADKREAAAILHRAYGHAEESAQPRVAVRPLAALPHSHEDTVAYKVLYGQEEPKEHKGPDAAHH